MSEEESGVLEGTILDPESHHTGATGGVLSHDVVSWVGSVSGVLDFADQRVVFQKVAASNSVFLVLFHSDVESFQTSVDQVTVEWRWNGAARVLVEVKFIVDVFGSTNDHAHDDIRVSVHVFGGTVETHVGAQVQWSLEVGRHESVVDDGKRSGSSGNIGNSSDIDDFHCWVGGSFHPDEFGVWLDRRFDAINVFHIDETGFDTLFRKLSFEESVGSSVTANSEKLSKS